MSSFKVTLTENRVFKPSPRFLKSARFSLEEIKSFRLLSSQNRLKYWEEAAQTLKWDKQWDEVFSGRFPDSFNTDSNLAWFKGAKLNVSVNCLDRHLPHFENERALVWEGEPGEVVSLTYGQLLERVKWISAALVKLGLKAGDVVALYMPMIPEAVASMLACARLGITHTVVFGGFSSESLKDRMNDSKAKAVITANFGYRKGAQLNLIEQVEKAVKEVPSCKHVLAFDRERTLDFCTQGNQSLSAKKSELSDQNNFNRQIAELSQYEIEELSKPVSVDTEHPLFILYTSGTTGKPKGLVHSSGGYLVGVKRSTELVFDLKPKKEKDLFWCTADIGWITGHSYVVYGPLAVGTSIFIYEGAPTTPSPCRFWEMIARHKITVFYTAPTAIRTFMKLGPEHVKKHDLSSLRLLGSVGEPINPEAWIWYYQNIGLNQCPVVDTFWQTETGSIVVSALPCETNTKPGSATLALPGYEINVVDLEGRSAEKGTGGLLVIKSAFPSITRGVYGDPERFVKTYFSDVKGAYFTGDGAHLDEDGYLWCLGRVDDVLNVSGHRLGTMEVESALVSHPYVAEAAVVGRPDEIKGQAIVAFVTLKTNSKGRDLDLSTIKNELKNHVTKAIGALARPDDIRLTEGLPKTRSGKIMRRLLRELASSGTVIGDTTTLEDFSVIASLQKDEE